jgi:hypothetical protein
MRPDKHQSTISAVRCDALFVSVLQRSEHPDAGQVRRAVAAAVRQYGDCGCAAQVAQEYGEHPEIAADRMRWARGAVAEAFRRAAKPPADGAGRAA